MNAAKINRGLSKADWLAGALNLLATTSVANLTIERLAQSLKISKSGFYWHFKSREELLQEMLRYWTHEVTEIVTDNLKIRALPPAERLTVAAEMILTHDLTRYEIAIRQWAQDDGTAAKAARRVNRLRLKFVQDALTELGFQGDELEVRSMMFVCYQTWESATFPEVPRRKRRNLISQRIRLLTVLSD